MKRTFLLAKLHHAIVTEARPDYMGSLTVDPDLLERAGMLADEQVDVYNMTNGNRLTTYIIEGKRGSGVMGINGAAAQLVNVGDRIIACTYASLDEDEMKKHKAKVLILGDNNEVIEEHG